MPTLLKANVTTPAGSRFVAAVANLTPTGMFLRTAEALRFRDKLTISLLGFAIPAEVLFISAEPAGVVVALATPFEARKALESRSRTVEVLEAPAGPAQPWEEDTNNDAGLADAPPAVEISDLSVPAGIADTDGGVETWALPEPVTSNQAAIAIEEADEAEPLALSASKIVPIVESEVVDNLPQVDSVPPMSMAEVEPSSDVDVPIELPVEHEDVDLGQPTTAPLDTGLLAMAALDDSRDLAPPEPPPPPPLPARVSSPPAPSLAPPPPPARAATASKRPSTPPLQVLIPPPPPELIAPPPAPTPPPAVAPPAPAPAAAPSQPPAPVGAQAPSSPPTPLPRSESLPVVDPTLPDLDGDVVRFTSRDHFASQFRSNLKQGGLVVRARAVPIGTQRLLALSVPGLDNYTVSARVVFSEPGKLGFMLDSFNLHKSRLQQMAELPPQAST